MNTDNHQDTFAIQVFEDMEKLSLSEHRSFFRTILLMISLGFGLGAMLITFAWLDLIP